MRLLPAENHRTEVTKTSRQPDLPQTWEVPRCLFRIRGAWWDQTRSFWAAQLFYEGLVHSTPGFWSLSLCFLSSPVLKTMLPGHCPTRSLSLQSSGGDRAP